jgi:hypothetical protein
VKHNQGMLDIVKEDNSSCLFSLILKQKNNEKLKLAGALNKDSMTSELLILRFLIEAMSGVC